MAEVWRAEHSALGTAVAVKVITGVRALDPRYHERFTREVQAVARLNHPGIVRVHDYGKVEGEGGHGIRRGSPFLVMELATQGTVEEHVPDDFSGLRRILLHVLDALAYSHARGVVHRDIKPGNVLLARAENGGMRAKLTDFGIAHADDPDTDMTRGSLNEASGTPDYMPPEQLQGKWRDYGPWTDLYALGCMAWEIATSKPPFGGSSPIQIAMAHLTDDLPPFEPRFQVPDGFSDWLHRLLEKEPHKRFERAADAAFMLSRLERAPSGGWEMPTSNVFIPSSPVTSAGDDGSYAEDEETTIMQLPSEEWAPYSEVYDADDDASTTVLSLSEMSWVDPGGPQPVFSEQPPVPRDWRREAAEAGPLVAGMGLGLFGLREIPFVGRHDERDAIWDALKDVVNRGKPRTVVITGRSGTGKSRLVQWVTERAEEVGAATVLRAVHGPVESRKHGVGHMFERFFVTWRLDQFESIRVRVQDYLQRLWADDERATLEFLDQESRALATVAAPHADRTPGQDVTFSSSAERLACVQRVVERVAMQRPLILWIDDAQWAEEALELVEQLRSADLPILVLLTVQQDAQPDEGARVLLDGLARQPSTRQLRLEFLEPEFQFELVQKLVGLDRSATERVVGATGGNPLFAVQLVGHWVEQGALVPSHDGFRVSSDAAVPREIHGLWTRRVDDLVDRFGGESQRIALELAATLGDDVTDIEWQATCIMSEVDPHERLIDELVDQGLAVRFEGGFSFVHKLLADSIRAESMRRGVGRAHNMMCGGVLHAIYGRDPMQVIGRVADHYVKAEAWIEAVDPLELVARKELAAGELVQAQRALAQRTRALDALSVDGFDRRRVDNWLFEGMTHLRAGNPNEAEFEFQRVLNVASPQRWNMPVALAQRGLGELAANSGHLSEALEAYNRAEGYFGTDADPNERASLYEARAEAFRALGNPVAAREDLERALDLHRTSGDSLQELNVFNRLASTFLSEGDMAAAREVAEMGVELGRQLGNRAAEAGCWMTIGEIERFGNNFEYARRCYAEAERLDELSGSRHVWVVRTNSAMLELAAENWQHASNQFDELEQELTSVGFQGMLPIVQLGQAVCHVAYGEWDAYDRTWSGAVAEIERAGIVERDIAWLAEVAGDLCVRRDDPYRSRQAYGVAVHHWETLGELWKARELRIRMRTSTQH